MRQSIQFYSGLTILSSATALGVQFALDTFWPRLGVSLPWAFAHAAGQALIGFLLWKGIITIYTTP